MVHAKGHSTQLSSEDLAFRSLLRKSLVAAAVGIPLFIWSFIGSREVVTGMDQVAWIIIGVISLAVLWYSGGHFFTGTWQSLKAHRANMYTLIAVATGPAWLYSMIVTIWPSIFPAAAREVHFDAPLTIVALIVFGSAFEMRASAKSSAATKKLAAIKPTHARVIKNNSEQEVSIDDISIGDIVKVNAGEIITVDGEIVEGQPTVVDASIFSPENNAVAKNIGDRVYAGTINKAQDILIKVTHVEKDMALEHVINMLKQAQNSKPSIGDIADKIAAVFAPLVLIIAIITPLVWFNFGPEPQISYMLVTFMAVLLIACPCALGLATPISIAAGVGKASEFGIIFRQGEAVQESSRLSTLLLDQTGLFDDAKNVIAKLKKMGVKVILLSQHDIEATRELAKEVDLEDVRSDVDSNDKLKIIKELQQRGEVVGFINDGSDDDTLKAADIGFAIGSKAYLSKSSDVTMLGNTLYGVVDAISISKTILRNIKQNLTGAFVYNMLGLPLAAGVLYPLIHALLHPILAGALMASSSLGVVLNANRLLFYKGVKRVSD